ncbi:bZIP_2 domain-containing protein [Cephalotus follicularis]|uniref:BZIP_2 domain-containing protein n=1 Tax=Cephalotus follicularis TaxID=3775 RepID=A0A1Q3CE08_CEPFO|nr:bZIP_2 domain-containing protein [Cephalotus follicularis]
MLSICQLSNHKKEPLKKFIFEKPLPSSYYPTNHCKRNKSKVLGYYTTLPKFPLPNQTLSLSLSGRMEATKCNARKHQAMRVDIEQMPDTPQRGSHHRRAHSDTSFRFDDLLLFDPSDLDLSAMDLPSLSTDPTPPRGTSTAAPMALDSSDDSSGPNPRARPINHLRSLSVDSEFFDGLTVGEGEKPAPTGEKRAHHHRHSNSMDGSTTSSFDIESMINDAVKKAMGPDRLAELALIDPKRAKRILANRQSAARSKERKIRYTSELERKVQTLQTEATTLSAQVTMLQRDTTGLTTENKELKMRLQAMEQQAHLRDALNEALREEVQRLKIATGQIPAVNGNPFNRTRAPPFHSQQPGLHHFGDPQTQQHQQQQQQLQVHQSTTNNQTANGQQYPSFLDFSQRS